MHAAALAPRFTDAPSARFNIRERAGLALLCLCAAVAPLALLLGRFSGRVLRSGEHIVPEAALEALADQNIPFAVKGKTTYEQQMAAIRGASTPEVQ